jgi:hypothetical protein
MKRLLNIFIIMFYGMLKKIMKHKNRHRKGLKTRLTKEGLGIRHFLRVS